MHDPLDAVLGAANYLNALGAPGNYRVALYHYNPVPEYVDAVMRYACPMTRDPKTFYAYYNWQVFVLTQHGDSASPAPALEPGCDSECCVDLARLSIYLQDGTRDQTFHALIHYRRLPHVLIPTASPLPLFESFHPYTEV